MLIARNQLRRVVGRRISLAVSAPDSRSVRQPAATLART